jgi:hypothetical protein
VDVIGALDETSYGMREFTLGDLNSFGVTFGPAAVNQRRTALPVR